MMVYNEKEYIIMEEKLVEYKINSYTKHLCHVTLNISKLMEEFRNGKINTVSAFHRRS